MDVTERKRTLRRIRLLADAGAILAEHDDPAETLADLARLMTETVADFAIVYRVTEGRLRREARVHRDAEDQAILEEFERCFLLSEDHAVARRLFESGEALLLDQVPAEVFATESDHARLIESMAPATGIGVPMIGAEGPVGIFAVATVEGGRLPLGEEDRTTVAEIARRTAVTLENAELQRSEREARWAAERRARRVAALQSASATLSRALTPEEVRRVLVDDAASSLGASGGAFVLARDEGYLEVIHSSTAPDGRIREECSRVPPEPELPIPSSSVFRTGEPLFVPSLEEWAERYPHLDGLLEEFGGRSIAYLPVEVGAERIGVLVLRFPDEREFPPGERAVLLALSQLAGHGLERARLFQAEREAREDAEVASVAKSQFLSVLSHELRTPLNAILGRASLLDEERPGTLNDAQRRHVDGIRSGAEHLTALIDEILFYSRAGTGREEAAFSTVDPAALAREVGELLEPRAAGRGLALEVRVPKERIELESDPGKLRHLLMNLLDNAIKFTDEGSVELAVEPRDGTVELLVADTGPGIPPEGRERIFEPFVQLDQTRTRTRGGTGLGLAVVARNAELRGAELEVDGGPDGGSVFRVRHPLRRAG